jgi:hypothetical protein
MFIIARIIRLWRTRSRQRSELLLLADIGFDFRDLGATSEAAQREALRWPWQAWSGIWAERSDAASGSCPDAGHAPTEAAKLA